MKKKLLLATLLIPFCIKAEIINFKCTSQDIPGIHKFNANGVVTVDDLEEVEGIVTVMAEKSDTTQSTQTFEDIKVKGIIRHFNQGELTNHTFDQLLLKTQSSYLKSLNLLLDFDEKVSSHILSVDNFFYRANCKKTNLFD